MTRHARNRLWQFTCCLLLSALAVPAIGQLTGPEFRVNSFTLQGQEFADVATAATGSLVVVWHSFGQDGSSNGVFGQRFESDGSPAGSEFQVNTYTTGDQRYSDLAIDSAGNFVVVWQSETQDGSQEGIFGQRFNAAGSPLGSEFQVNSDSVNRQRYPAVAADLSGNFVVVWQSFNRDGFPSEGVFGRRFDSSGNPQGGDFQVNTFTTGNEQHAAVAMDASGDFVVVWDGDLQDGAQEGVFARRFDSAGIPQGGEFQVNTYTPFAQKVPAIAAESSGSFVVVWSSGVQDGSGYGVFGRRYDASGTALGVEFQVNTYTHGTQQDAAVVLADSGNFVAAWISSLDGSNYDVLGRRFDPVGAPIGAPFLVNTYTTSYQFLPSMAVDTSGRFTVVWQSMGQDASGWGIFGKSFAAAIFEGRFETGDACAWSGSVGGGC